LDIVMKLIVSDKSSSSLDFDLLARLRMCISE
jgi:hypothetical protein